MHIFSNSRERFPMSTKMGPKTPPPIPIPINPQKSKTGNRMGIEAMEGFLEHWLRRGELSVVGQLESVRPDPQRLMRALLLNSRTKKVAKSLFRSLRCEVFAPVEIHPFPRKRDSGCLTFYRPRPSGRSLRIQLSFDSIRLLNSLGFLRFPLQRLHVDVYVKRERVVEILEICEGRVEELVWRSLDADLAVEVIGLAASVLRSLEADLLLFSHHKFPPLDLISFKCFRSNFVTSNPLSSLIPHKIRHLDLSEASEFLNLRGDIPSQPFLQSARLRLQFCQSNELRTKALAIRRFAPNLRRVEFVRMITGIEFDSDLSQFLFLEIGQIHDAVRAAAVEDFEISVRCVYSLQPEESSFRSSAILVVICGVEKAELLWRPPARSITGESLKRRKAEMPFGDAVAPFRCFVRRFVAQMETDYRSAECY